MINIELLTQIYCPRPLLETPVCQETFAFNGKRMFTAALAKTEDLFPSPVIGICQTGGFQNADRLQIGDKQYSRVLP
jgi:hypothetical protein